MLGEAWRGERRGEALARRGRARRAEAEVVLRVEVLGSKSRTGSMMMLAVLEGSVIRYWNVPVEVS